MRDQARSKKRVLQSMVLDREELRKELQDFTNKEDWDKFYRGGERTGAFEWYTGWSELAEFLPDQLMWRFPEKEANDVRILVPACGNSTLSEHLSAAGFTTIVNVDFSEVVIMNMDGLYWIRLPEMKWRVMDMTKLQFLNGSFDAVVDKGGLDSLTDSLLYPRLGNLYLSEVKRVLGERGKFICFTLAQSHVIDMLFHKFRYGWKVSLHAIAQRNPKEHIFAFVAEKDSPNSISNISLDMGNYSASAHDEEAIELLEEIIKAQEKENDIRTNYLNRVTYSLEEVLQGARGNVQPYEPGRRIDLILGEPGVSGFIYSGMLLDANESEEIPKYPYTVYLVPHSKARDSPLSIEGGQWVLAGQETSRLLKVFLDSSNSILSNEEIQVDLSGLVKHFSPFNYDPRGEIRFVRAFDEIKWRDSVYKVMSYLTGPIMVEDVIYYEGGGKFRRLIFQRSENLIQSEALLSAEKELKNKGTKRKFSERSTAYPRTASSSEMVIDRDTLESTYHKAIISGILLIGAYLSFYTGLGDLVKTVILGLGGGLLPMFMRNNIPSLKIEVVELDSTVERVARDYFGFEQDRKLSVQNGDAIEFVKEKKCGKFDILVLDVDLSDRSSGLSCPNPGFLQEPFLRAAQESLSDQGVFILNLITRSSYTRLGAYSCLMKVFGRMLRFEVEEDASEVLFAFKLDHPMKKDYLSKARGLLVENLDAEKAWCKFVLDFAKSIEPFR